MATYFGSNYLNLNPSYALSRPDDITLSASLPPKVMHRLSGSISSYILAHAHGIWALYTSLFHKGNLNRGSPMFLLVTGLSSDIDEWNCMIDGITLHQLPQSRYKPFWDAKENMALWYSVCFSSAWSSLGNILHFDLGIQWGAQMLSMGVYFFDDSILKLIFKSFVYKLYQA